MDKNGTEQGIEQALDTCLEKIINSRWGVEECLAKYPDYATELQPLLDVASASYQASNINPGENFKAKARYEFNAAVADMASSSKRRWFEIVPIWAKAVAGALVAVLISGGALVAASDSSLPGQTLYGVKLAAEQAQMAFTFSQYSKTELYADLANKRVSEIAILNDAGKTEEINIATHQMETEFEAIVTLNVGSVENKTIYPLATAQHDQIVLFIEGEDSLLTQTPDIFMLCSSDTDLVCNLKDKGMTGYLGLVKSLEMASPETQPVLEEALIVYLRSYAMVFELVGR